MTYICNFRVQEPCRVNRESVVRQDMQQLLPKSFLGRGCVSVTQTDKERETGRFSWVASVEMQA